MTWHGTCNARWTYTPLAKRRWPKQGKEEIYLTADTNEICETPDYMVEYLERVREQSPAAYDALLYVEQPTHRDLDKAPFRMDGIDKLKPVIMDESLYNHRQYERAKELGWSGIALKVCKGHSHSLLFTALATHDGLPYTVQDLTNPDLSLVHSLGFAARINPMKGVECNSRQFFPASNSCRRRRPPPHCKRAKRRCEHGNAHRDRTWLPSGPHPRPG